MKIDMNPQAVTKRLRQTSKLRRLCLELGKNNFIANIKEIRQIKQSSKIGLKPIEKAK